MRNELRIDPFGYVYPVRWTVLEALPAKASLPSDAHADVLELEIVVDSVV